MLAVVSEGSYPPMDRRVVTGLRKLRRISKADADKLEFGSPRSLPRSIAEGRSGVDQRAAEP